MRHFVAEIFKKKWRDNDGIKIIEYGKKKKNDNSCLNINNNIIIKKTGNKKVK